MTPRAPASLHQAITIEHRMDGAFGRDLDTRKSPRQALADLPSTPARVLALDVEDVVLDLKGELMGISIRTSAPVGQPLNSALLVALEDLVAGLTRDAELSAQLGHRRASQAPTYKLKPLVHHRTLLPRHPHTSSQRARKCNPCVRYDLSPICRVAHHGFFGISTSPRAP